MRSRHAQPLLDAARGLRDEIRSCTSEIDAQRTLPRALVESLTGAGVFRASVPKAIGGDEVDLITQLETFEELARADASVGWCAMIGAQTGTLAALLEPEAAKEIYGDANVRTGGVFAPSGRAVADGDSFRLSGRWSFGSGVAHTDWYALGAVVMDGEQLRTDGDRPDLRFVFVPTSQLDIEDTWDVSGLRGTGSNHISVEDVVVPDRHTFPLLTPKRRHPGPLYRFPLFSALAAGVSSVALGVARDAIDELDELASTKTPTGATRALGQRSAIQIERARAEAELRSARAFLFDTGAELWTHAASGDDPTIEQRASLRLAATHAVRTAADVVDRAYDAGGGTAIFSTSRLQRTFRDVHAITQHLIVSPPTFELVGRVLLGVETDVSQL